MSEKEPAEPLGNNSTDINALQQELNTLKATYSDLESRYNSLNTEYSQYKFDIEFNRDINHINSKLDDKQRETLKSLKSSNEEAYKMLLDSFKVETVGSGFNPVEQQEIQNNNNEDAFTQAIRERKGE